MDPRKKIFRMAAAMGLVLMLAAVGAAAVEPVSVLLEGQDAPIEGYLREISPSRYLLQGQDVYHEFPGDQIVSVDGEPSIPGSVQGSGRLLFTTFYEKVLPNGDVELWSRNEVKNDGALFLTETDWGAAEWEKERLETLEVYDNFANRLPVTITPRDDGGYRVEVAFEVPVAPGESLGLSLRTIQRGAAKRQDGRWSYTFMLDFNEDRYLTRKIELPAGARDIAPYPGCWNFDREGGTLLISQHYYPAHTREPLVVRWTMP